MKNEIKWRQYEKLDPTLKEQLLHMNEAELEDAFYQNIEFGTAGMRGKMGPGTNRINQYVIYQAATVFGQYLLGEFADEAKTKGVVIAHDNRLNSRTFCYYSANALAALGIKVYIFDDLRSTPLLSYSVRELHAAGGIVITASHNPKEDNGFKVYDENGCQLVPNKIEKLLTYYGDGDIYQFVEYQKLADNVVVLDHTIDERYYDDVEKIKFHHDQDASILKVVYTPQHGTGFAGVNTLLTKQGYDLILVQSQCTSDPNFSNTLSPNPEEPKAYVEAIKIAKENDADLILCTDPDADRIGVGVKKDGEYIILNGNQTGALLCDYILSERKKAQLPLVSGIIYNTIVTAKSTQRIADEYGVEVRSLLTGFKFIGDQIEKSIKENGKSFLFGYEESYGSLISSICRDKDAIQASVMIAEMALFYKKQNLTLYQALVKLYERIGYFVEKQVSIRLDGIEGPKKLALIMEKLRKAHPETLSGYRITSIADYQTSLQTSSEGVVVIDLPKSNVILFELEEGSRIIVRPSGTEPKCKFYYNFIGNSFADAETKLDRVSQAMSEFIR